MKRSEAIELLGGDIPAAAKAVGVSYQAVNQWPAHLSRRIEDRVLAACVRHGIPVPPDLTPTPKEGAAHA